jgi:hypothetical protein
MQSYEQIISAIRSLGNGTEPSVDITNMLTEHGCLYLLSKCIYPGRCYCDNSFIDQNKNFVNEYFVECKKIFSEMQNIVYALVKGAVLSKRAYRETYYRNFGDIDLLIERKNASEVKKILLENGFVQGKLIDGKIRPFTRQEIVFQGSQSHQTAPFVKKAKNELVGHINIDLNYDVYWGEMNPSTNLYDFLSGTEIEIINDVRFKALNKEADFLFLCLHQFKHLNSIFLITEGSINLARFCDIYYYIKNNTLNIDSLLAYAKNFNAESYVYYCLHYASEIFGCSKINDAMKAFCSDEGNELLNCYGLNDKERKEWNVDFNERLFNDDFPQIFYDSLDDAEKRKVSLNRQNM